jgi:hypothetical protein
MAGKNLFEAFSRVLSTSGNEQWFSFHLGFNDLVKQKTPVLLGIEALYPAYEEKLNLADVLLEQLRKSFLTDDLKTLDTQRDDSLISLKNAIKAHLKSSDNEKRKDAHKVMAVLDNYGNMARMNYPTESAAIYNFVQDMEGKFSREVKNLELNNWVNDVKRFNTRFMTVYNERFAEEAEKPDLKLADVRKDVDAKYNSLIKVIEAFILTNPNHELDDFVRQLNIVIKKYKTIDAQAKGRKNPKTEVAEE